MRFIDPEISKKVSKPITMRERFDQVVPDYYATHYRFSSDLTHPSRGSFSFKLRSTEDGEFSHTWGSRSTQSIAVCA